MNPEASYRIERDSIGEIRVPREVLYGAQTQCALDRNPVLVTALTSTLGYEKCAEIAKRACAEGRPIKEIAQEMTGFSASELDRLLDPLRLARPHD